ncbi:DNA primase [Streptomyces sp. p1417]|uniref:DNA primase n=1 Tax=Streptomyces typhae TaxID=2681492 RepID=A0A6L6X6D8_9ACTN|nr:bifunctional DNA primase/polymerase [Streptomyces typhae]MVO89336.1 DNA primase [Streptomyces typhae]
MREILGRRRRLLSWRVGRKPDQSPALLAALTFATAWRWPVLPGVGTDDQVRRGLGALDTLGTRTDRQSDTRKRSGRGARKAARGTGAAELRGAPVRCACPDPDCAFPGAHPLDPGLLAATTDERMVRWWWTNRPGAPVLLATGGRAPCAVSLPAVAGARALAALDKAGVRLGPVVATQARVFILVAPYSMEQLGALLYAKDRVPGSLRFHGDGGYVALPPSETGQGQVRWERAPAPGSATPWVPDVQAVVDAVVDALTRTGVSAPEL